MMSYKQIRESSTQLDSIHTYRHKNFIKMMTKTQESQYKL